MVCATTHMYKTTCRLCYDDIGVEKDTDKSMSAAYISNAIHTIINSVFCYQRNKHLLSSIARRICCSYFHFVALIFHSGWRISLFANGKFQTAIDEKVTNRRTRVRKPTNTESHEKCQWNKRMEINWPQWNHNKITKQCTTNADKQPNKSSCSAFVRVCQCIAKG